MVAAPGRPHIWHSGGTWGFLSENDYFPKLHEFVIALANSVDSPPVIVSTAAFNALNPAIGAAQDKPAAGEDRKITTLAQEWTHRVQTGDIDRTQLTAKLSAAIPPDAVGAIKAQMSALGVPKSFIYRGKVAYGGVTVYKYRIQFNGAAITLLIGLDNQGKIAALDFRP